MAVITSGGIDLKKVGSQEVGGWKFSFHQPNMISYIAVLL
jgi:hypothetical protein